jgi:hypothetical protein
MASVELAQAREFDITLPLVPIIPDNNCRRTKILRAQSITS